MVIRTQDRNGLVPFDSAVIMFAPQINKFVINDGNVRLGCYETLETAQKVLDDIEEMYVEEGRVDRVKDKGDLYLLKPRRLVFDMPEEDKV